MPYEINWLQENHVVLLRLVGDVDLDEVTQISNEIIEFIHKGVQVTPLVHFVMDSSELKNLPLSLGQIGAAVKHFKEPGMGWSIVISPSSIVKFFASILAQASKARFRVVISMDEAMDFLAEQDANVSKSA